MLPMTCTRLVDKLVRVYLRNGAESWILVHVEVQGQRDKGFERRMFVYYYRLFDRYRRTVVSLAVLADDEPNWRPQSYSNDFGGCRVSFEFPLVKLLDWSDRLAELPSSRNPFEVVLAAHLVARATRKQVNQRAEQKFELTRTLYEVGFKRDDILKLYRIIDWLMALPRDLEQSFQERLQRYEEETRMPYITSIEQTGIEKGIAKLLRHQLEHRFGRLPPWAEERLESAQPEEISGWGLNLLEAQSLEEVFETSARS